MKIIRVLIIFVSFALASVFWGVDEARADASCGDGSRCQAGVTRTYTDYECQISGGRCVQYSPHSGTGTCGSGPGNCGFNWNRTNCNFSYCGPVPGCIGLNRDVCYQGYIIEWYDCCVCEDVSWGECDANCGGGKQTSNCGNERSCNTQSCCTESNPDTPTLVSPAVGTQVRVGVPASLNWNAIANWGTGCPSNNDRYEVCVMSGATCDLVNYTSAGVATTYNWTPSSADSVVTWKIRANNNSNTAESTTSTVCVEGGPVYGAWGACDASHKRTRTCTETCGTDDCTAGNVTEDCVGTITGTLFDASNLEACPADLGANPDILIKNQSFLMTSPFGAPSWPTGYNGTVTTNGSGNYTTNAFSPGTYGYDFTSLGGAYNGLKLSCSGFPTASLFGSDTSCLTMPCTPASTGNNFGLWRVYGGWWQVTGGSVYAKDGIRSEIPASMPAN
jgi:hypothetical protein